MFGSTKLIRENFALNQLQISLLGSAVINFFHSFCFIVNRLEFSQHFWLELTLHFFLVFSFLFFCSFNKKIFLIAAFLLLALSTISAFFYNQFGIIIDQSTLTNADENKGDAASLLNIFSVIFYLIFFLALPFFIFVKLQIKKQNPLKYLPIIAFIFLIFSAILAPFEHNLRKDIILRSYAPVSLIEAIRGYWVEQSIAKESLKNLKPIAEILPDLTFSEKKIPNLKVVFVIGESARQKNFSLNGYERETNPLLSKVKNLLSFKDVTPCYTYTSQAVSCLMSFDKSKLSESDKKTMVLDEESVIKAFEKLGFSTAWFSMQKAVGNNNSLLILASQSQKYFFDNQVRNITTDDKYDEALLRPLAEEIKKPGKNFIILQGNGSHFLFDERYPESFKKFPPTCSKKDPKTCTRQELVNSYDNSILYTDYFLSQVIARLKNENAILFYVSDHGQFLGEENLFYHGNSETRTKAQHRVPLLIWMSDSLLKNKTYAKRFENAAQKTSKEISHANIFDSLLQCSGADSKAFERNLSLCRQ